MSDHELQITNGRIVRPGFYRAPDGSGVQYAKAVGTGKLDSDCVFCPEALEKRGIEILHKIGSSGFNLYVIQANPAYAHFDAQEVVDHKMIIPEDHIESEYDLPLKARQARDDFIRDAELSTEMGTAVQSYTRSENNPSKSIGHLHTHLFKLSLRPLTEFAFDIDHGVSTAEFAVVTDEQIEEIEQSRRQ